jgi:hypothetical protein
MAASREAPARLSRQTAWEAGEFSYSQLIPVSTNVFLNSKIIFAIGRKAGMWPRVRKTNRTTCLLTQFPSCAAMVIA